MKSIILLMGLLSTLNLWAQSVGSDKGNGGDAVVCQDSVKLLDSVEMRQHDMTLDLPGQTMREKVLEVIRRIKKVDPVRAEKVKKYALEIIKDLEDFDLNPERMVFENVRFTTDELSDIPDSLEITIPEGCVKQQLVTQLEPVFPKDKRYNIAVKLWRAMDDVDQRTLTALHEAWYRTFIEEGASDSRFARYMNATFASFENSEMTFGKYYELLQISRKMGGFGKEGVSYLVNFKGVTNGYKLSEINRDGNYVLIPSFRLEEGRRIITSNWGLETLGDEVPDRVLINEGAKVLQMRLKTYRILSSIKDFFLKYELSGDHYDGKYRSQYEKCLILDADENVIVYEGYFSRLFEKGKKIKKGISYWKVQMTVNAREISYNFKNTANFCDNKEF